MKPVNIKKLLVRIVITVFIASLIEILGFNFSIIKALVFNRNTVNVTYKLDDMEKINWDKQGDIFVSRPDPMLVIPTVGMFVKEISIEPLSDRTVEKGVVFYIDNKTPVFSENGMILVNQPFSDEMAIPVDKYVKSLRIDLGEAAGLKLENIIVTINPASFHISISRIIAMVLIYLFSIFLFSLQRSPDYGI